VLDSPKLVSLTFARVKQHTLELQVAVDQEVTRVQMANSAEQLPEQPKADTDCRYARDAAA
jgi:hypothetical protein